MMGKLDEAPMGQAGRGPDGASWTRPRWGKLDETQMRKLDEAPMGQDGRGPDGANWTRPRWGKMGEALM